jgi:putative MATE family efflux protein
MTSTAATAIAATPAPPAPTPAVAAATLDPRTRLLLEGPIAATLLRLAAPNVLVMGAQASVGLIETFFIGKLGTDALAGMALVFPVVMLMQMMSAGAFGGAMASAVARALGSRRSADANALVFHALAIAATLGLAFMAAALLGGHWLYGRMGGDGAALAAALVYSNWVFAGALLVWIFNALAALIRGTGNMNLPALVTVIGSIALVPLSPLLIFGWGPLPGLGIAGGALALLLYYAAGCVALGAYLLSRHSLLKPDWAALVWRWPLLRDILKVGSVGAISTIATNLVIAISTAMVAGFGAAALAGYGTASRLEYLMVPLVFGFGAPLVSMVGTCVGAGQRERALKVAWIGAGLSAAMTETIGLAAALFPRAWLSLFDSDPAMLAAGSQYLQVVGPVYGFFGLALSLYFASQGAGRLLWPIIGNLARLLVAAIGGWLALRAGWGLAAVFGAQALALIVYGLVNSVAIARGAWFKSGP